MQKFPKTLRGIFLDLDDTLFPDGPCNDAGIHAIIEFLSHELQRDISELRSLFDLSREEVKKTLEQYLGFESASSHARILYFSRLIEKLTSKSSIELILKIDEIFWSAFFDEMKPYEGAREFLKFAKSKNLFIGILTDMTHRTQLEKLQKLDMAHFVDIITSSEEVGKDKPHPAILELALEKIGLEKKEIVYIGESEKKDMGLAKNAGIYGIQIRKIPNDSNIVFVENFNELKKLLCASLHIED